MRNKRSQKLVTSPFSGCQICSKIFFSDSSPDLFDALIQRFNRVIPKITIGNLRKKFHDVIMIPFLTCQCCTQTYFYTNESVLAGDRYKLGKKL